MEEEGRYSCCCSGGEARPQRRDVLIQLLRQKETRNPRLVQLIAAGLLLLISGALALLVTVVFGERGQPSRDSQPMMQPYRPSSGVSVEQLQLKDFQNPSAMLTVPEGNISNGEYLQWESDDGNAFCHGGFKYSSGNLVVPTSGIYRVFLQITYESKKDLVCVDGLRLTNSVSRIQESYNKSVTFLSSVDSVSCNMEQWSKTLYTAGLFYLEANGRLRVTSSHLNLIVRSEHKVFFGAELLPQ
ncbi:lymphotoxin-alpha-like [Anoplopoma fimbria]|uniref:lymphotoxin-alpha-like n=1 Tax=Anoplopoma fimbria TaxID=229290 RepID=UPI0023ECEC20|nr:lymphotoxin-alpha-like [Anoplopoma fimbria]